MIKAAINISLVPELPQTPHFHPGSMETLINKASDYGYRGIEIFPKSAEEIPSAKIDKLISKHDMELCVFGSGAGKALQNLTFTDSDPEIRKNAVKYVGDIIEVAADFNAMMMIGSMLGNTKPGVNREMAMQFLTQSVLQLLEICEKRKVTLIVEPVNRYESDLINTIEQCKEFITGISTSPYLKIIADFFHMNIEEPDMSKSIIKGSDQISHYHFVDSNRLAPGMGHIDFKPIGEAIAKTEYVGYLSVECFTSINEEKTMKAAIDIFNKNF